MIRRQGFDAIALSEPNSNLLASTEEDAQPLTHAAWLGADWATDAEQTLVSIGKTVIDWLIVDHYAIDIRWESIFRPRCGKIMVIDDLADRDHDCDLLLDQNLVADLNNRYDKRVPLHCRRLIGPRFALLQQQYAELHLRAPPRLGPIKRILVFFGGADSNNLTAQTIAAFISLRRPNIDLDVVVGSGSPNIAAIRELTRAHHNITLYESLPSLASLFLKADLSIGAGGATSWERCCLGVPSLIITIAENQRQIAAALHQQGYARWLAHHDSVNEFLIQQALHDMLERKEIDECSTRCMKLVDGRGTKRVLTSILLDQNSKLKARSALLSDEYVIFSGISNPIPDLSKLSSEVDLREDQQSWFYNCLRNTETSRIFIIETDLNVPVGYVYFELSDGIWNLGYVLDIVATGMNFETQLLQAAILAMRQTTSVMLEFGTILHDSFQFQKVASDPNLSGKAEMRKILSIAICSDSDTWINAFIPKLLLSWLLAGHRCVWAHSASDLPRADLCFYLSYGRIVDRMTLNKFSNNLVVHESALPAGKGWSPLTWQILEGRNRVQVTLLEAAEAVDSGLIYAQSLVEFDGYELIDELRTIQAEATFDLCGRFVAGYPETAGKSREQLGIESFYKRRRPVDSELDTGKSLAEQFNLLRVVDNERYPAFFNICGNRYIIKVISSKSND